ncbi:DUF4397 domain-containing protein [Pedobacter sp. MC2016-14]|uniref:DUF4397 domain-containing protein n=1 Tax=Pedobacter sp. MC2016-14 TaxID=2897327 RepID=UPI001E3DB98A|nr:DUF4397 domain-containing protein [Pedobacter sp. MC2016-14]MCD0488483.1 DUF4397 domain-containing protein [Pedobacter sp. MC2016-14]
MKSLFDLPKRTTWALMVSCFGILALSASCTKDNPEPEPIPTGDVKVQFVNAFSGSAAQEFYVTNARFGTQTVAYGQASGYATTNTINNLYAFKDAGSTAATVANADSRVILDIGGSFTFYYYKPSSPINGRAAVAVNDNTTAPASGKAKVRFIHFNSLIANTVPLKITVQGTTTALVSDFLPLSITNYYEVDPAAKFTVEGLASPVTFSSLTLTAGKIYTIWLGGTSSTEVTGNLVLQN